MLSFFFRISCIVLIISTTICQSQSINCTDMMDCSYNGICNNNKCDCFPQWKGIHCSSLNLIAGSKSSGLQSFINNSYISSWGGSVIKDNKTGIFHMIASEMINNCGINSWLFNSQIIHSISNDSLGTFIRSTTTNPVISGIFSHEPKIIKALNTNQYVIYFTNTYPPITTKWPCNECNNGSTDPHKCEFPVNYTNGVPLIPTKMIYSDDLETWSNMIDIPTPTPWLDSNLDCFIFINGSLICLGRSATNGSDYSGYFIEKATNWKDNTTYFNINITENINKNIDGIHCCGEDPFIWFDHRFNVLHSIWHYNNESNFGFPLGIHIFSIDGGLNWNGFLDFNKYPPEYAYQSYVEYTDGTYHNFTRCERPKLIIDDDGYTLLALTNGVQPYKSNDYTFTLLRPINQQK